MFWRWRGIYLAEERSVLSVVDTVKYYGSVLSGAVRYFGSNVRYTKRVAIRKITMIGSGSVCNTSPYHFSQEAMENKIIIYIYISHTSLCVCVCVCVLACVRACVCVSARACLCRYVSACQSVCVHFLVARPSFLFAQLVH